MSFIHQQFQSFLNLGGCKEYFLMAKPRLPKKNDGVNVSAPANNPSPSSDTTFASPQAVAAPVVPLQKPESQKVEAKKTETKKAARPEIVKTEPRANLVPINLEEEIRRLAYLLSERRGFEPGHDAEDWLAAEREVRQRYHQQSA
jgi:hypothetical protein